MKNEEFYKEIDLMFESHLSSKKDKLQIRVKNISQKQILGESDMNYSKMFFDSDFNMYKINKEGSLELVQNENFEAVVTKLGE